MQYMNIEIMRIVYRRCADDANVTCPFAILMHMTTQEIAEKLVSLCREGKYEEAHDSLYDTNILSVEMDESMGAREARGIDAIKAKGKGWSSMFKEPASTWCDDAIISGNSFACRMGFAGTGHNGEKIEGAEIAVFVTKNGKIIEERFFW
jgi:hypothetical protein